MSGIGIMTDGRNATTDDCGRLWRTMTHEYIPGLCIRIVIIEDDRVGTAIRMECYDHGPKAADGSYYDNIWAAATYFNELHLISSSRLFDLLIIAYRRIDDFFAYGESNAPERRQV